MDVEKQYLDGSYFARNPEWDRQDCIWKASLVKSILDESGIEIKSICEVGCGSGDILAQLRDYYPEYELTGYDISPQVKNFWDEHKVNNIHFHCGNFLDIDHKYYDCILLIDVIEHLSNPFQFLNAIRERAKYFIFHFPLDLSVSTILREKSLLNARIKVGHIHYFTKGLALAILRESGFNINLYRFTNAYLHIPNRSFKTRLASFPRRLFYLVNMDFGARLLGGETLIALAESSRNNN